MQYANGSSAVSLCIALSQHRYAHACASAQQLLRSLISNPRMNPDGRFRSKRHSLSLAFAVTSDTVVQFRGSLVAAVYTAMTNSIRSANSYTLQQNRSCVHRTSGCYTERYYPNHRHGSFPAGPDQTAPLRWRRIHNSM